jgi:acyl-CoA dehydrogenase
MSSPRSAYRSPFVIDPRIASITACGVVVLCHIGTPRPGRDRRDSSDRHVVPFSDRGDELAEEACDAGALEPDVDDIAQLIGGLEQFLDREVISRHRRAGALLDDPRHLYGADGRYQPHVLEAMAEVRQAAAAAGYYAMLVPEDLGGGGLGHLAMFHVWATIARRCSTRHLLGYSSVAHWARGPSPLVRHMTPEARASVLPDLLRGATTMCFAMSEADAGSDAWMMRTHAEPSGDGWVINGMKQWITNGPYADHAIVFAVTDPDLARQRKGGISAFLVPTTAPGFRVDSVLQMFGHSGGDEAILSFDDVWVPNSHVVGSLGRGFTIAIEGVSAGRMYNTGRSVGLAEWALDLALGHAEQRRTFGQAIIEHQAVSFPLADSAIELHAARLMGIDCAHKLDAGLEARTELSMCKAYATEMATRTLDRVMQVHGAMGFTNEVGLAEAWQHARRICVADGSAEILRRTIVQQIRRRASRT